MLSARGQVEHQQAAARPGAGLTQDIYMRTAGWRCSAARNLLAFMLACCGGAYSSTISAEKMPSRPQVPHSSGSLAAKRSVPTLGPITMASDQVALHKPI